MSIEKLDDQYTEKEAAKRRDAIVRTMIATPPTPQKPLKDQKKASRPKRASAKEKPKA